MRQYLLWLLLLLFGPLMLRVSDCEAQVSNHNFGLSQFIVYRVDLVKKRLELWSMDQDGHRYGNAGRIKTILASRGNRLLFATNSGIFDKLFRPLGLHVENGRELRPLNLRTGEGNFFLQPNGVFYITQEQKAAIVPTEKFKGESRVSLAVQSGPLLVNNGVINKAFNQESRNLLVRSGVGVVGTSEVYFAISKNPVSFYEFSLFFRDLLGCKDALYLDGVISRMYTGESDPSSEKGDFSAMLVVYE